MTFFDFIRQEEGVETIEYIALVAVAAILISIIVAVSITLKEKATSAKNTIDQELSNMK